MCISTCRHRDIDDDLVRQAIEDEQNIQRQKGENNPTTNAISKKRDYIGSLAQNSVFAYLDDLGIAFERSEYFNPERNEDNYDFVHRGSVDVKGKGLVVPYIEIYPRTRFIVYDHQRDKEVDWYCFVGVDTENMVVHIAGIIDYNRFWDIAEAMPENPRFKTRGYFVQAKDLEDFNKYAWGV